MGIVLTADRGFTDLSPEQRDQLPYEIYHPDDFFVLVDDSAPQDVRAVAKDQLAYWSRRYPSGDVNLVVALEKASCPQFALRVQQRMQEIQ